MASVGALTDGEDFDNTSTEDEIHDSTLTEEEDIELDRAVLDGLRKSLDGSTDASTIDIHYLLNSIEYRTDAEDEMNTYGDEDWQDIRTGRTEPIPLDLIPVHDSKRRTAYYIKNEKRDRLSFKDKSYNDDAIQPTRPTSEEGHRERLKQSTLNMVFERLTVDNGRFAPRHYQEWMARKVRRRCTFKNDMPGYTTLCDACHQVLTNSIVAYSFIYSQKVKRYNYTGLTTEVFTHLESTEALRASGRVCCHLCVLLYTSYIDGRNSEVHDENQDLPYFLKIYRSDGHFFEISIHAVGQHSVRNPVGSCYLPQNDEGPSTLRFPVTNAPEVVQLAREWLIRCLREDTGLCSVPTKFLPSRLVQVTGTNEALKSAHLVFRDELSPNAGYLTLSHCWGDGKMASLTGNLLCDYKDDIPLSRLSKTFLQALQLTLWLGYQYIWIDSLCIQQDSKSDWENEAAMMGAIYRHSTCTIAATAASDGSGGLFFERSALVFTHCPLFEVNQTRVYALAGHKWPTPLLSRAWAVQERCLSPRTLSFGSDKISWACRRTEACEGPRAYHIELPRYRFAELLVRNEENKDHVWAQIVRTYSGCILTYWKDRWPAFQGLTNEVAKVQNWKFVHGLRYHALGFDLLWLTLSPEPTTLDIDEPSWSWLNCKGEIYILGRFFPGQRLDCDIVLQKPVVTRTIDAESDIMAAVLRIEGYMNILKMDRPQRDSLGVDCSLSVTNPLSKTHDGILKGQWYPDTTRECDGDVWALQISKVYKESNDGRYPTSYTSNGLVVTTVKELPGFWTRIGRYTCQGQRLPDGEGSSYRMSSKDDSDEDEDISVSQPCPWSQEKTVVYLI